MRSGQSNQKKMISLRYMKLNRDMQKPTQGQILKKCKNPIPFLVRFHCELEPHYNIQLPKPVKI